MNANQFSANFYQCSCHINIQWAVVQKTALIEFPLEGSKKVLVNSKGRIAGRRFFHSKLTFTELNIFSEAESLK